MPHSKKEAKPARPGWGIWTVLTALVVLCAALAVGAVLFLSHSKRQAIASWESRLSAMADGRASEVENWLQERRDDASIVARISDVTDLLEGPARGRSAAEQAATQAEVNDLLAGFVRKYGYVGAYVLDARGEPVARSQGAAPLIPSSIARAMEAIASRKPVIEDFRVSGAGSPSLAFDAPVFSAISQQTPLSVSAGPVGVVILAARPQLWLFPLIQREPTYTRSGEVLLIEKQGEKLVYLAPLRHSIAGPLTFSTAFKTQTFTGWNAILGRETFGEITDYRGKKVLAVARTIQGTPWSLVVKVDEDEALQNHRTTRNWLLAFLALILISTAAFTLTFLYRMRLSFSMELAQKDERYRLLNIHTRDMMFFATPDGHIIEANPAAERALGYSQEELEGMSFKNLRSSEAQAELKADMLNASTPGGAMYETVYRKKDGSVFPVEESGSAVEIEGKVLRFSVARDITERKKAEEALRETEGKLTALFEILPVGVTILDAGRNILYANPALEGILDISREGLSEERFKSRTYLKPDGTVMPPEEYASMRAFAEQREVHNVDTGVVKEDGSLIWASVSAIPVSFSDWKVVIVTADITERKRAEESLRESEARYKALVENQGEGVVFVDPDETFVYANPAAERIFGCDPGSLVGQNLKRFLSENELEKALAETNLRRTGKTSDYEQRIVRPSGEERVIHVTAVPRFADDGTFLGTIGICLDTTERKRAEEALKASEDRYRDLVENASDLICTHDLEGTLLSINASAVLAAGFSAEEVIGRNLRELLPPGGRDRFDIYLETIRRDRKAAGIMKVVTRAGEARYWEYRNTLRTEGVKAPMVRGMARDVTEEVLAKRALKKSEQRYRQLFERNLAGVYRSTIEGCILDCNDAFAKIYGYSSREEALQHAAVDLYPTPEARRQFIAALRVNGTLIGHESQGRKRDGSVFWMLENACLVLDEKGDLTGIEGTLVDITDRKCAEDELKAQADRLECLNQELQRFNRLAVGREQRMIELKQQMNELAAKHGEPPPFPLDFLKEE